MALSFSISAAAKRAIKQSPALWSLVRTLRQTRARFSASP